MSDLFQSKPTPPLAEALRELLQALVAGPGSSAPSRYSAFSVSVISFGGPFRASTALSR